MPAAARKGDRCVPHCSPFSISKGSASVFINGQGAARVGDAVTPHLNPGRRCSPHTASISSGSKSVYIDGKKSARVGSKLKSCTMVSGGSPDVFIGGWLWQNQFWLRCKWSLALHWATIKVWPLRLTLPMPFLLILAQHYWHRCLQRLAILPRPICQTWPCWD